MKAIILAAGYATRLYPLTVNTPKCLLNVGGVPMIDIICEKIKGSKHIDGIIIVTNDRFYKQLEDWKAKRKSSLPVRIVNDKTTSNDNRLGAIGDLRLALKAAGIKESFVMLASDNLFDMDLNDFMTFAEKHADAASTGLFDIKAPSLAAGKYGVVEINEAGEITGMEEKPQKPKTSLIGTGVYYFPASVIALVDKYLNSSEAKDAPGHFIRWLNGHVKIFGFILKGMWYDIGDLKSLEEADRIFSSKINGRV